MGPPGVGKTTIAQQIAKDYKLHHIHVKDVISQAIETLNRAAKQAENEGNERPGATADNEDNDDADADEEEEIDEEDEDELPDLDELEAINENMESNNGPKKKRKIYKL